MTCARTHEWLRIGREELRAPGAAELHAHAQHCPECSEERRRLEGAIRALATDRVDPSDASLTRIRRALIVREAPARAALGWLVWPGLAAAVAAVLLVALVRPDERTAPAPLAARQELVATLVQGHAEIEKPKQSIVAGEVLPSSRRLKVDARSRLSIGKARLVAGEETELTMRGELARPALVLDRGYLAVALAPLKGSESFMVVTPSAVIEVVGTVFRVKIEPIGTWIEVEEGVVRAERRDNAASQLIHAGEKVLIPLHLDEHPAAGTRAAIDPVVPPLARVGSRRANRRARARIESPERIVVERPTPPAPAAEIAGAEPRSDTPPIPIAQPGERADRAKLREARAALPVDAPRARAIAEQILDQRPEPAIEAEALMIGADASRRSGDSARALAFYLKVAQHPSGSGYAEEALLRAARLQVDLQDRSAAQKTLSDAAARFADGALGPERAALALRLMRENGQVAAAAKLLEASGGLRPSPAIDRERLAIAALLIGSDPERASKLVTPLLTRPVTAEIRAEAERISRAARSK